MRNKRGFIVVITKQTKDTGKEKKNKKKKKERKISNWALNHKK
jgi:hypothetical protein